MGRCRRHPHHIVVGVCAYCLSEHLSALLEREEYDARDGSSNITHLHTHCTMRSPHTFTPSNPSTTCATGPDTPFGAPRQPPPRLRYDPSVDDVSPKAASHQCFSLPFSPQHRLRSDSYTPSNVCSPQNHVLGNHDFIRGEIPRKKKTSFWSFLHRRKAGFYNTCGVANMRRNYALDQDATSDYLYDDNNHIIVQQNGVHKDMHFTMRDMHSYGGKTKLDRNILSKVVSSSAYSGSFGRDNPALQQVSLPQHSASPKHYLNLSKQKTSPFCTSGHRAIGLSPLRHEKYVAVEDIDDDVFSQGLRSAYTACGFDGYGDAKSNAGLSSSWGSNAIFPQKMRRSMSISGLSDVSDFGPTIEFMCQLSRDTTETRAKSVSCENEEISGSPKGMPVKAPQSHVNKKSHHKSTPNSVRQETYYNGHRKSPKSSSPNGLHHFNAVPDCNQNSTASSKPDAHKNHKCPHLSKPAVSLLSRSRPEPVSIDCGKATRVSPLMLAVHKKSSSPHSLFHGTHDRLTRYCNPGATQTYGDDGHADGSMQRYMPAYQQGLGNRSTVPSDDECQRSPSLFDLNVKRQHNKSWNSQALKKQVGSSHNSKDQVKEPAFGSHVFAYSTTRSLSKALGNMLGIRRGKKQSIKVQAVSPSGHAQLHHMEMLHNMRSGHQSLHNADYNDGDESDFIDYDQSDLYEDHYPLQHMPPSPRQCANIHHLQATESQALPDLEAKGPPQQYSFLSKDYSAFSYYFSPPQAFQKADVATEMGSYTKHMQVGKGAVLKPRKSNSLLSLGGAMHSIRGRSGRR